MAGAEGRWITLECPHQNKECPDGRLLTQLATDEGIFAVTDNATTTKISSASDWTKNGGGRAASVGEGRFRDRLAADITTERARIAFPDDFNIDSLWINIAFVGLSDGTADGNNAMTGNERGDVYKVILQPTLSSTIDLNVRGLISTIHTSTNIWSIDVSGNATTANIVVGTNFWSTAVTNYYWLNYCSSDSGATWSTSGQSSSTGGNPTRDGDAADGFLISGTNAIPVG